jgi:predicted transcriptional regulator
VPPDTFTPRELDVMSILWDLRSATVSEVQEHIADTLAYTTVLSSLRTLEEKGYVRHEGEGRAFRYYPLLDWTSAGHREIGRLLKKVFKGSPELLLVQLVSDRGMDQAQLRRLRALVDERLGDDPNGEED